MYFVAPFAGAWIEIIQCEEEGYPSKVAPFAGAWSEITGIDAYKDVRSGRSLRGSVD